MKIMVFLSALTLLAFASCQVSTAKHSEASEAAPEEARQSAAAEPIEAAPVNADSVMSLVEAQCAFGPRVPGTSPHEKCAGWLKGKLEAWCDEVHTQKATLHTFDGKQLNITNLIGVINPQATRRVLLLAHWDCRPWADNDADESKRREPVMGANDAASGTAVLLELARVIHDSPHKPTVGIDLLLADAEDWGDSNTDEHPDSWALGTQYWTAHTHVPDYTAECGILLDMVGASGANFTQEVYSLQAAPELVQRVWNIAQQSGFGGFFRKEMGGMVTDDHVYVNQMGIKCIDIIDMRPGAETGFFDAWHTTHDTLDRIDPQTLAAVGQTLVNFLFNY